jgi:hypothetical protein
MSAGSGMEIGADHIRADLAVAVNRDFGIDGFRSRGDRGSANGNDKKPRKDYGDPPATHEAAPQPNKPISADRRGGSVTDYVEI